MNFNTFAAKDDDDRGEPRVHAADGNAVHLPLRRVEADAVLDEVHAEHLRRLPCKAGIV